MDFFTHDLEIKRAENVWFGHSLEENKMVITYEDLRQFKDQYDLIFNVPLEHSHVCAHRTMP